MCCTGTQQIKPMQVTQNAVQRPVAKVPFSNDVKGYEPNSMVIPKKVKDDLVYAQQLARIPKRTG